MFRSWSTGPISLEAETISVIFRSASLGGTLPTVNSVLAGLGFSGTIFFSLGIGFSLAADTLAPGKIGSMDSSGRVLVKVANFWSRALDSAFSSTLSNPLLPSITFSPSYFFFPIANASRTILRSAPASLYSCSRISRVCPDSLTPRIFFSAKERNLSKGIFLASTISLAASSVLSTAIFNRTSTGIAWTGTSAASSCDGEISSACLGRGTS